MNINEDNLGRCFLHRRGINKGLLREKEYKCVGCKYALKYEREYWRASIKVKEYLKENGLEFKESKTSKGYPTLITKKVKCQAQIQK